MAGKLTVKLNTVHELVQSIKQNLKLSKFGLWFTLIVIYYFYFLQYK